MMPFSIEGWIEIDRVPGEDWWAVVNVGGLIDVGDEISEQLFALSRTAVTGKPVRAMAARRGWPFNLSPTVLAEKQAIEQHEAQYGKGEMVGITHATWREMLDFSIDSKELLKSDWKSVFDILRVLEQRFEPERLRAVVWCNW